MKTIHTVIVAIAIVASFNLSAQEREAPQLDLGDLGWTGTVFDSVTAFFGNSGTLLSDPEPSHSERSEEGSQAL